MRNEAKRPVQYDCTAQLLDCQRNLVAIKMLVESLPLSLLVLSEKEKKAPSDVALQARAQM